MKIQDVLKSDIPNEFKDKNPKKKIYKVDKSQYGVDSTDADAGAASGASGE